MYTVPVVRCLGMNLGVFVVLTYRLNHATQAASACVTTVALLSMRFRHPGKYTTTMADTIPEGDVLALHHLFSYVPSNRFRLLEDITARLGTMTQCW